MGFSCLCYFLHNIFVSRECAADSGMVQSRGMFPDRTKEGGCEDFTERVGCYIFPGKMGKGTWFRPAPGVDMHGAAADSHAPAVPVVFIIGKIEKHHRLCPAENRKLFPELPKLCITGMELLFTGAKGHKFVENSKSRACCAHRIDELFGPQEFSSLPGQNAGEPEQQLPFLKKPHCIHNGGVDTIAPAGVGQCPVPFDADNGYDVPDFRQCIRCLLIDQGTIGNDNEQRAAVFFCIYRASFRA